MKKLISTLILAALCVTLFAGCGSTLKDEEKGAIINVYIGSEITNYDPALAYLDDSAVKVLGLVYEGLTRINEKGKVENALMKSYEITEKPDKNEYSMEITLKQTKWSDGRVVSADDVVYAWKRILDPEFSCAAAPLLFDIKNARDVKMGDNSIDDLGIAAVDTDVLEIQFEGKIDYNRFLENLASLALVPLREDVVERYESFGTATTTLCTNGPFVVKLLDEEEALMLERNVYYRRDTEKDPIDKYILPYRFIVNFDADEEENTLMYENSFKKETVDENGDEIEKIYYLGEIALSKRADYEKKANISDLLSTHSVMFNTKKSIFKSAETRRAMSMAIDRNALVDIVTYADAATGLIPPAVYDTKLGDSFRANGGALISAEPDVDGAKALVGKTGRFTLTCRENALEMAVAEYLKGVWEELGFGVTIDALDYEDYMEAYIEGDYDAITLDYQALSTDSFGALAVFAPLFSGNGIDIQNDNYDAVPYVIGYDNEAYNALIESAFAENDRAARSAYLHDAEELLMEDMPIIPLFFNKDAYVYNGKVLSKIEDNYMGYRDFDRLTMKNWRDYQETEAK